MGEYERKEENGGGKGNGGEDDADERDVVWSFVFFSLEKQAEEPWPLPLLGEARMDPELEEGVGKEGGEWVNKGNSDEYDTEERRVARFSVPCFSEKEGEEPWPPPLLFL